MKKKTITIEAISLHKETIARLDEKQLNEIAGGGSFSCNVALEEEALAFGSCCNGSCSDVPTKC